MNKKINIEFILGLLILIISIICIFYYSSKINLFNKMETIQINSSFFDIGNVNIGNDVKIKGVKVGEVSGISLDQENYMAIITSSIYKSVKIPDNSTFKISNYYFYRAWISVALCASFTQNLCTLSWKTIYTSG